MIPLSKRPENNELGQRMRTCETCGVGLGTMARREYVERFVQGRELCPSCGKPAIGEQKKRPEYRQTVDLAREFDVSSDKLARLVKEGKFRHVEVEEPSAGMPRYYVREDEVAARFAVREA